MKPARVYGCPVELALETLGGKWRVVILARVKEGACRYADLRRLIPRMSDKMLTQRLHELVDAGLLARRGNAYTLTPLGDSARTVLGELYAWGEKVAVVVDARIADPPAETARAGGSIAKLARSRKRS